MNNERNAAFAALRKQYIQNRFSRMNPMQQEAVYQVEGALLILAGAGSGKTTVLVNRIANLVEFGNAYQSQEVYPPAEEADIEALRAALEAKQPVGEALLKKMQVGAVYPYHILAITFTNKAAGELKSRLAKIIPHGGQDISASTFHSACVRMLRRDADKLGFPKNFTIYDSDDQQRVLKDIYKQKNLDDKFLTPRAAAARIGRLKDSMVSPKQAAADGGDFKERMVAELYAEYAQRLQNAGAMDFDDLIYFTVRLLEENPDVRAYYENLWRYILVDEYQDTSHAQFRLVQLLSGHGNVCVVGDDDQSIYRFRGATIENILSFEKTFPGAKVIRLEQNYRSTQTILDAANQVICNNAGRKGKTLWTENGSGEKISLYTADSEQDEAMHIAEVIGQNVRGGAALHNHAVLYRMNAQSNAIETYFARSGIPYKIIGGQRFYDRKEIRDMLAYLSIVVNPQDDLRLRRIINEPSRKIGAATVDAASQIAFGLGVPLLEVVLDAPSYPNLSRASGALSSFGEIYRRLREAHDTLPLDEFVAKAADISGYRTMLKAAGEEGKTRLENIDELVSSVKTYADQKGPEASLEGFLEEVALISDIDSYDEGTDAVTMMTLHSAKGLEFDTVFIVGLEEGVFPGDAARYQEEEIEEERRLCYVGITRARKNLCLSRAEYRMLFGQTRRNPPSRFLEEIDHDLLEETQSRLSRRRGETPYAKSAASASAFGLASARTTLGGLSAEKSAEPAPSKAIFKAGDVVDHKVFGRGIVRSITPVAGDCIVEIDFETVGRKKTMANYAPISLVQK